jgi:hypothetical protein
MDRATTQKVGTIVVIDHYTKTADSLISYVQNLAQQTGGKIMLGEIGAPIPDIHGAMTATQQQAWLDDSLAHIAVTPEIVGVNYWVSHGGSTALFDEAGRRPAATTLSQYYTPHVVTGTLSDMFGAPLVGATVASAQKSADTDVDGNFRLPVLSTPVHVTISKQGFRTIEMDVGTTRSYTLIRNLPALCLLRPWTVSLCDWVNKRFSF